MQEVKRYNKEFYNRFEAGSFNSAKLILPIVLKMFPNIKSAADFGCGVGVWLSALKDLGVNDIMGYDGEWVGKEILKIPFENFTAAELDKSISFNRRYDLALSIETAEHLPEKSARLFVETLTKVSDLVLFSAAIPYQGGTNHINEQWQDYWNNIFIEFGYIGTDYIRKKIWNNQRIRVLYRQNIILFVKKERLSEIKDFICEESNVTWNVVHPETYTKKINQIENSIPLFSLYKIAMKRTLKKIIPPSLRRIIRNVSRITKIHVVRIAKRTPFVCSDYKITFLGEKGKHSFFGYYDISPFNTKTDEVIYLTLSDDLTDADIVLEDLTRKTKQTIVNTKAWNWQQGCRLRWFPGSSDEIIFNDFMGVGGGGYCSKIVDVRTKDERLLHFPLYDINKTGKLGITLDFSRLGIKRPGYGYTVMPYNEPVNLADEGLYLVDIQADISTKILTYRQIAETLKMDIQDYGHIYLNHLCFNPSGDKFMFFYLNAEHPRHEAYLLVYDLKEAVLRVLEPELKISHYVWEDDDHIIGTSLSITDCGYYRYDMFGKKTRILPELLIRDGHPSLYKDGKTLTDTYPDKQGYQTLFLFDEKTKGIDVLAKIFSVPKYTGERRTDLHPRFNSNKTRVSFDANINGYRNFCYFNMNNE
jgi:hypothetical protein